MSKQIGVIKLDGAIGGIAFYQSGGQHLARVAHGPTKQQIATQPNFIRTRENNAEFGGSAHAAKALRSALSTTVHTMGDARITGRLTKLFREICAKDAAGIRGQRSISLSAYGASLVNFEFNKGQSFDAVFNAPFTASHNADRNQGDIKTASFLPSASINAPAGATHFRLIEAIGTVSDYGYDIAVHGYVPDAPDLNALGAVDAITVTPLDSALPASFSLSAALAGAPVPTAAVSVIQCLGIEFYQHVGAGDYLLAQGNAMKVVAVF